MGGEARLGEHVVLGIAGGASKTDLAVADRGSDGNIDSAHAAIYGGVGAGALRLRAGLGYAWLDLDTSRTIAFRGFTDSATARYDGQVAQFFTAAGHPFDFRRFALEPAVGRAACREK